MLPPLHFFPRHGGRVINNYYGNPMPMWNPMISMQMMMFKCATPFLIGGMFKQFGTSIANIISGNNNNVNDCNCGCNGNYGMFGYNMNFANTMYPYVNLNNNQHRIEGTGGTEDTDTTDNAKQIKELNDVYKDYGITVSALGDKYVLKLKGAAPEIINDYDELLEKLNEVAQNKITQVKPEEETPVKPPVTNGDGNEGITPTANTATPANTTSAVPAAQNFALINRTGSRHRTNFSDIFSRGDWGNYKKFKNNTTDPYRHISLNVRDNISNAGDVLKQITSRLGISNINTEEQGYKKLLKDFIAINPSLFDEQGNAKRKITEAILAKMDVPTVEGFKKYGLEVPTKKKPVGSTTQNLTVTSNNNVNNAYAYITQIITTFDRNHNWLNTSYNDKRNRNNAIQKIYNELDNNNKALLLVKLRSDGIKIEDYID